MEKRTELYRYEAYNFPDGKPRFIVDDDYAQLIEICCKYSSMISFLVANENVDYLSGFSKYEIKSKRDNVKYNIGYGPTAEKRYYAVCDEVKLLLKNATKDLFMWIYDEYEKII